MNEQTNKQINKQINKQTHKQTNTHTHTHTRTHTHTHTHTGAQNRDSEEPMLKTTAEIRRAQQDKVVIVIVCGGEYVDRWIYT